MVAESSFDATSSVTLRKRRTQVTKEKKLIAKEMLEDGHRIDSISEKTHLSVPTIKKIRRKLAEGELFSNENTRKQSLKVINLKERMGILLSENPCLNLFQLKEKLIEEGIQKSSSTISRTLKKMQYSRKVAVAVPVDRNSNATKIKRATFCRDMQNISDDKIVFLDEFGINLHVGPDYGYSPVNSKVYQVVPTNKGVNVSVLCCISVQGVLCYTIKQGAFTSNDMCEFIQSKLPYTVGRRKILCLDNAAIHKTLQVKTLTEQKGYLLKFTAPYSPQLNAIEEFFSSAKARYKSYVPRPRNFNEMKAALE